ncbi:CPBP family intramembrane glutamic endopeptidase [Dinghuibacter silviterrae]|uniref:CAAX prenyl protease 2/Lysostaphin resistance protein A-like domain-containing protein n=1 Tax=Dinghuibacter silviterrae TaxID=1539049 RepID=A0A4R8DWW3_9BACT|nr:CPBP family intramembrane glutamic endopeptidase [Dinghuibacter silviterrae]TDX01927.1 hypothetical protein EDB95_2972 [Dinghuibacter silviterrae]
MTAKKILDFPLRKILIGLIVIVGVIQLGQRLIDQKLVRAIVVVILTLAAYILLFRFYEKRKITELSPNGMYLVVGILLGALLQTLTIGVIYLNHDFTVISINPIAAVLPGLIMAFTAAIIEEVLIRGVLFRIMEEKLGSLLALGISALIFGLLHLANPNSSLITAMGIAIEAGLLLGVAYMYSRNLWFPIAIHFAWNFTQSGIFGASTSGVAISDSLLTSKIQGATWVTGGAFGPEGSVQAPVFCLVATGVLMVLCYRQGKIVPPFWKKQGATQFGDRGAI